MLPQANHSRSKSRGNQECELPGGRRRRYLATRLRGLPGSAAPVT
jgi:hypothetical protein